MNQTRPEDAGWEVWDRNRLLRLVEKLQNRNFSVFHNNNSMYSIGRALEARAVHLCFMDCPDKPRAVCITKIVNGNTKTVEWLAGGLRAWIDALEIDRDLLLEAIL